MSLWKLIPAILLGLLAQVNGSLAAGENLTGKWAAPVALPLVPSSGAVLPNGKLLLWAADGPYSQGSGVGRNYSVLVDPGTGPVQSFTTVLGHNMFCTGITVLDDGRIMMNGGGVESSDTGATATSIYDPATNAFSRIQDMIVPRGYNANTILTDGSVFTLGGSWSGAGTHNRIGEVWDQTNGWHTLPGVPTTGMTTNDPFGVYSADSHFWLMPTGNGKVLYVGPSPNMKWINTNGSGSVADAGPRGDDVFAINGTAVMYDAGKILKAGGAASYGQVAASNAAYKIDTTQGTGAAVTKLAPMAYARSYINGVALPDGKVAIVGGQSYLYQGTDSDSVLATEIWDPATGNFTAAASLSIPRNYHSIAMLLPDARVIAAGGGLCNCSGDHPDYQIYSPPYLYDASGNLATRPVITAAPTELTYGGNISVSTDRPVTAFSLVRMSAATHTVDNDQRRLAISFNQTGTNQYSLNIPSNSGHLLPGYWMLFAMDGNGVPSVSKIVRVQSNKIARLVSPAVINANVGLALSIQPEVVKLQNFVSFGATGLPPGLSVNPVSGLISGTPTTVGVYNGSLTATDGTQTISTYLSFNVAPVVHSPVIATPVAQVSASGSPVTLAMSASDPDGDSLTFEASGLPPGLSINATSGVISGSAIAEGIYNPTVRVTDPGGLFVSTSFAWTVTAPVSRTSLFSANSFEGHGTTAFVTGSFTPAHNSLLMVVVGTSYSGSSSDPANLTVSGGGLAWTRQLITSNTSANESAVQFWSAEVTTAAPMTLTIDNGPDNVYLYMVHVRNYTGYNPANMFGASVVNKTLSPPTGTMTLSAAPAATSEVLAARVHNASSGTTTSATPGSGWTEVFDSYPFPGVSGLESQARSNSTSQTVAWTNINDSNIGAEQLIGLALEVKSAGGVNNSPPAIFTPATQVSALGASVNLAVSASDPNGDSLTYSAFGLPNGLSIAAGTGVISGTTTAAGSFSPTVTVTDSGGLFATATFSWTVNSTPVNRSPTIATPAAQTSALGAVVSLGMSAADPDGDSLTFSATGLPGGLGISAATGLISGTTAAAGPFNPVVKVTDSGGLFATATFSWNVTSPSNQAPSITAPVSQVLTVGDAVSLAVTASDPDGDALVYEATGLPAGLSINATSGLISGTIAAVGTFHPNLKVTDGGGLSATTTFNMSVADTTPAVASLAVVPQLVGATVVYSPVITKPAGVTYSWNFGDGSGQTAFSATATASHVFASAGVYSASLILKSAGGNQSSYSFIQAIHAPPLAAGVGMNTSTMALDPRTNGNIRLWVANRDNNSVSVINLASNNLVAEIPVGTQPVAVGLHKSGKIWVLNRGSASISIIDTGTLAVTTTIPLARGMRPGGMVFAGTSGNAFVTLEARGQLVSVTANGNVSTLSTSVAGARFIATNGARDKLYLSSFITPPLPGESTTVVRTVSSSGQPFGGVVLEVDTNGTLLRKMILRHSDTADSEIGGRGIPNYLGAAAVSPDGKSLWVPSKQDNIKRGELRDTVDLNFQNTVRAIASRVDLTTGNEDLPSRVDLDNSGMASAAVFHPTGALLFVALPTSRQVAVVDPAGKRELFRFNVGRTPNALALSSDGSTLYVLNYLDRSVSIIDLSALLTAGKRAVTVTATVNTITTEKLAPEVFRGKQLFNDAADPRLARDGYLSCAVCHDGGEGDGRTWDLSGSGEGLRNTISLIGHGGMAEGFLHWTANFDEIQDFEGQIRRLAGGTGLMSDADFNSNDRSSPLGGAKAGLSPDLDALAAYVSSLTKVPASPFRTASGALTHKASVGKSVFTSAGCGVCHAGTHMTISGDESQLKDVGTINEASGARLEGPLTGIDVPGLRGLWASAPYLHNGSAGDVETAIRSHSGLSLTETQIGQVAAYLRQVEQAP